MNPDSKNYPSREADFPMTLLQARKQELISDYQVHETDTGSADVQIAMLTDRINQLSAHLQKNKKDYSSRRGLLKMIGHRKRLMAYLQKQDSERYRALIKKLGIRG
jgi:small subunit ribosomal protein S15